MGKVVPSKVVALVLERVKKAGDDGLSVISLHILKLSWAGTYLPPTNRADHSQFQLAS